MHSDKCTKGEATITENTFQGRPVIAVGILGTKKAIAICGFVGAPDEEESKANALRIATDWNRNL